MAAVTRNDESFVERDEVLFPNTDVIDTEPHYNNFTAIQNALRHREEQKQVNITTHSRSHSSDDVYRAIRTPIESSSSFHQYHSNEMLYENLGTPANTFTVPLNIQSKKIDGHIFNLTQIIENVGYNRNTPFMRSPENSNTKNVSALLNIVLKMGGAHGPLVNVWRSRINNDYFQRWYLEKYNQRSASLIQKNTMSNLNEQTTQNNRTRDYHSNINIDHFAASKTSNQQIMNDKYNDKEVKKIFGYDDTTSSVSSYSPSNENDWKTNQQKSPTITSILKKNNQNNNQHSQTKHHVTIREHRPTNEINRSTSSQQPNNNNQQYLNDYQQQVYNNQQFVNDYLQANNNQHFVNDYQQTNNNQQFVNDYQQTHNKQQSTSEYQQMHNNQQFVSDYQQQVNNNQQFDNDYQQQINNNQQFVNQYQQPVNEYQQTHNNQQFVSDYQQQVNNNQQQINTNQQFTNEYQQTNNNQQVFNDYQKLIQNHPDVYRDPNPQIITKPNPDNVTYQQNISVRYLVPPTPPPPGPLIIREIVPQRAPSPPPLIVKHQQPSPPTPPPLILREAPPPPPPHQETTVVTKVLPPEPQAARRLIVEHGPPLPPKPQPVIIEKWLPYKPAPPREVIYERVTENQAMAQFETAAVTTDRQRRHSAEFQSSTVRVPIPVNVQRRNSLDYIEKEKVITEQPSGTFDELAWTTHQQILALQQRGKEQVQAHRQWAANQWQQHTNMFLQYPAQLATPSLVVYHQPVTRSYVQTQEYRQQVQYNPRFIYPFF